MVMVGFPALPAFDVTPRQQLYLGVSMLNNLRRCWSVGSDSLGVIGPPRYGKTSGVVIPSVMSWAGPVLCVSVGADVLRFAGDQRRRVAAANAGDVYVYDPLGTQRDIPSMRWSPLAGCADASECYYRVLSLTCMVGRGFDNEQHWKYGISVILRTYLHAAALAGLPIAQVRRWLTTRETVEPARILRTHPDAAVSWVEELDGLAHAGKRDLGRFYSMALVCLDVMAEPSAAAVTDGDDLDLDRFLASSSTLFAFAPTHYRDQLGPLYNSLVDALTRRAAQRARGMGGQLSPPLLVVYDDFGLLPPVRSLPGLVPDSGPRGIITLWAAQSLSHLRWRYSEVETAAILTSTAAKMIYGGISNEGDLNQISGWAGRIRDTQIAYYSAGAPAPPVYAAQAGLTGGGGASRASDGGVNMPILPPEALQHLPPFHAWLFYRSDTPLLVETRPAAFIEEYQRLSGCTPFVALADT